MLDENGCETNCITKVYNNNKVQQDYINELKKQIRENFNRNELLLFERLFEIKSIKKKKKLYFI